MATAIVDLDGTIVEYGTNKFLDGALHNLHKFVNRGNQVVFITAREDYYPGSEEIQEELAKEFPKSVIIWGSSSPRILVNDEGAVAINHQTDDAFGYDLAKLSKG